MRSKQEYDYEKDKDKPKLLRSLILLCIGKVNFIQLDPFILMLNNQLSINHTFQIVAVLTICIFHTNVTQPIPMSAITMCTGHYYTP